MATFEVYRDATGEYRWRLRDEQRYLAAFGPYTTAAAALDDIGEVRRCVVGAEIVDLTGE